MHSLGSLNKQIVSTIHECYIDHVFHLANMNLFWTFVGNLMKQVSTDSNVEKSGDLFYVLTIGHTIHMLDYVESNKKITVTIFTSKSGFNSTFREQGEQGIHNLFFYYG